jgi:hypothetical protein
VSEIKSPGWKLLSMTAIRPRWVLLLVSLLSFVGMLRVSRNAAGEVKVSVTAPLSAPMTVNPVAATAFLRSGNFSIRNGIVLYAVFYDEKGTPALVIMERTNSLRVAESWFAEGEPTVPGGTPQRFGSVNTLRQLWKEQGLK